MDEDNWFWVCGRDRETGEWVQCVRWRQVEDAKIYCHYRVRDFQGSIRIEDESGNVLYLLVE